MIIKIEKACRSDAKRLAEVYNMSFYSDYLKYGECPGYNKTENDILDNLQKRDVYKIIADGAIVGQSLSGRKGMSPTILALSVSYPNTPTKALDRQPCVFLIKNTPTPDTGRWRHLPIKHRITIFIKNSISK